MPRPGIVCLLVALVACGINPAFEEPHATTTDATTTTAATAASTSTTAPVDPTSSTADTGGATDALSGGPTTTGDDTTSTSGDGEDTTGTTDPPPEPEHLQHFDPEQCEEPLWCHTQDSVFSGQPARIFSQACFSPSARPYRLVRLDYIVAATFGDLTGDSFLEIRAHDADRPGQPLVPPIPLVNADLLLGTRQYVFDPPIELDVPTFCVGFTAGRIEPMASLGLAIDPTNLPDDQSYIRSEGVMGCNAPFWLDIHDFDPTPKGGWCIAADVEPVL